MSTETIEISGLGTYEYELTFLDTRMRQPKPALLAELIERAADEPGDRAKFRKLGKIEIASILADFDTASAANAAGAAKASKSRPQSERRNETRHPDGAAAVAAHACPTCKARKGAQCFKMANGDIGTARTPYVHATRMAKYDGAQS